MAIAWCQATGIYGKMLQDVIYKTKSQTIPNTRSSKIRAVKPLSLEHLIPPFIMIAIGLALSAIAFSAEMYHQRRTLREKWDFFQRKQVNKNMRVIVRAVSPQTQKINVMELIEEGSGMSLEARTLKNVKEKDGRFNSPSLENGASNETGASRV